MFKRTKDLRLERGQASNYIKWSPEVLCPGDKVILCCRVSEASHDRLTNLKDQELNLVERAAKLGAIVINKVNYVGSGIDPYWLAKVVDKARLVGAKLLAETTDRFIRHPDYHSNSNPNAQARNVDLEDLKKWTEGVVLVTDLHPDALPREVRFYQQHRGQVAKHSKGGRPVRREWKKRRMKFIGKAKALRESGLSYRQIAGRLNELEGMLLNVTHVTVYNWLNGRCRRGTCS
jgi:hypothetical protein